MQQDNGVWRRKGGGFLTYKLPSNGVFTFAVYLVKGGNLFRGGRVRWVTDYVDSKNYVLSELDDNNLTVRDFVNGKTSDHGKFKHNVESKDKAWAIQIEISPERLIQRIQKDQQWITLDTWTNPEHKFADGKFGFWVFRATTRSAYRISSSRRRDSRITRRRAQEQGHATPYRLS